MSPTTIENTRRQSFNIIVDASGIPTEQTVAGCVMRETKCIAHPPNVPNVAEPVIPARFSSSFPGYPSSCTADEGTCPVSRPDSPLLVLFGKALWMAGACAMAVSLLVLLAGRSLGSIHTCAPSFLAAAGAAGIAFAVRVLKVRIAGSPIYLIDFACFGAPQQIRLSHEQLVDAYLEKGLFKESTKPFLEKILANSGMGPATALSHGVQAFNVPTGEGKQHQATYHNSLLESEWVLFDTVDAVLKKTNTHPSQVDVVITACSCFAPTPSMAAMIVNRFKMRSDVITYSLGGMGCSSSIICIDLAKNHLRSNPNTTVLIVNHENLTACSNYKGVDKQMLMSYCLFRMGGAAILLSNQPFDARRAKYELVHSVRTHLGNDDQAFQCMGNGTDSQGQEGIFLRKSVVAMAGKALQKHLRVVAPLILPMPELVIAGMNRSYIPSFRRAAEHFLLHTGGRAVLDSLEDSLQLTPEIMKPARETLYRFGNTSSASTWYILAYVEQNVGVKEGERLWQLGFGGGFKANSAVWRARRSVNQAHPCWAAYWPNSATLLEVLAA